MNRPASIPIVTVHGGDVFPNADEGYVGLGAKQALLYNPRFILLGGPRNKHLSDIPGLEWHDYLTDYSKDANHFAKHAYRKLSGYSDLYDLAVLKRYFVLREFMETHGIFQVFSCDSDTMIYADVTREAETFGVNDIAFCIPATQLAYRWSASSHFSYFTLLGIREFCKFITDTYTDPKRLGKLKTKWTWHKKYKKPGGVCDMTFLYLYSKDHDVTNLSKATAGVAFDHHANTSENWYPDEYRMSFTHRKQITWKDSQPYGFSMYTDSLVRFAAIHLQGGAKKYVKDYVRQRAKNY